MRTGVGSHLNAEAQWGGIYFFEERSRNVNMIASLPFKRSNMEATPPFAVAGKRAEPPSSDAPRPDCRRSPRAARPVGPERRARGTTSSAASVPPPFLDADPCRSAGTTAKPPAHNQMEGLAFSRRKRPKRRQLVGSGQRFGRVHGYWSERRSTKICGKQTGLEWFRC